MTASEKGHRDLLAAIGKAIRLRRVERDIKRSELAERAGLSYAYVSEIENGTKQASSKALWGLARALGMEPHELMVSAARMQIPDRAPMEPAPAPAATGAGGAGAEVAGAGGAGPVPGAGGTGRATWFHLVPSAVAGSPAAAPRAASGSPTAAPAAARVDDPDRPAAAADSPGSPDLLARPAVAAEPPGLPHLLDRLAAALEDVPDERAELALMLALDARRTRRIVREELDRRRPSV